MLEKSAYVNTLSVAFTPMVPVFAAVFTFMAHTLAGNDLSAPQVRLLPGLFYTDNSIFILVLNLVKLIYIPKNGCLLEFTTVTCFSLFCTSF